MNPEESGRDNGSGWPGGCRARLVLTADRGHAGRTAGEIEEKPAIRKEKNEYTRAS